MLAEMEKEVREDQACSSGKLPRVIHKIFDFRFLFFDLRKKDQDQIKGCLAALVKYRYYTYVRTYVRMYERT